MISSSSPSILTVLELITHFDGWCLNFTVVQCTTRADCHDFATVGLFSGRARQDDTASRSGLFFAATNYNTVVKWTNFHLVVLLVSRIQCDVVVKAGAYTPEIWMLLKWGEANRFSIPGQQFFCCCCTRPAGRRNEGTEYNFKRPKKGF
jgi:hypothetical protein